jgi:HAD superfamily hydrolase (TIGR01509 family)
MIKVIIFDLDGVLFDTREMHFEVLNTALAEVSSEYVISAEDHTREFNGLTTIQKLNKLAASRNLPEDQIDKINFRKQKLTLDWIRNNVKRDRRLCFMMTALKNADPDVKLYVASNSVKDTVQQFMYRSEIEFLVDDYYGNQDTDHPKPAPSLYLKAMAAAGVGPNETLIIEDSSVGCAGALASGAHVMHVSGPEELTHSSIDFAISCIETSSRTNCLTVYPTTVVIPMAGAGSRFTEAGFTKPKPMISFCGSPMIKAAIDSLKLNCHYTFLAQKDHIDQQNIDCVIRSIIPYAYVKPIDGVTEGSACTVLQAARDIGENDPLIIANADQYVDFDYPLMMQKIRDLDADGCILTFDANETKWSYAKLDADQRYVTEVAEKKVISQHATCGIYWWRKGGDFIKYVNSMIEKNIRTNGEFYICPVFNEAIADGKKIVTFDVKTMLGLGTPEDLKIAQEKLTCF